MALRPYRVLCIVPASSPDFTSEFEAMASCRKLGYKLTVLSARSGSLRYPGRLSSYEVVDGIPIFRIYRSNLELGFFPFLSYRAAASLTRRFSPDLIFAFGHNNLQIASRLAKELGRPVVCLVEDASSLASGQARSLKANLASVIGSIIGIHPIPVGRKYWDWVVSNSSQVITMGGSTNLGGAGQSTIGRVAVCGQFPPLAPAPNRAKGRGIYIGTFHKIKNTDEFYETIPRILEETPTEEFLFVGRGDTKVVEWLIREYPGRIHHYNFVPRPTVFFLLTGSFYACSPSVTEGHGFITECWATRTPVVTMHTNLGFIDGVNSAKSDDLDGLVERIRRLYQDEEYYRRIQDGGYTAYIQNHSGEAIAKAWARVWRRAMSPPDEAVAKTRAPR